MTTPAQPLAAQPDPMLQAFTQRAQQQAPAATASPNASASGDPMLDAFTARKARIAQPQQQGTQEPEQPGFGQRTYEASGLKGIIETAKQKWQASQVEAQKEQQMASATMEALKSGNYGQAAELLLQHLSTSAKNAIDPMGIGRGTIEGAANSIKSNAESKAGHVIKGVRAAQHGEYGKAALEAGGAVAGGDEDTDRIIEDVENKNLPGLAGDVVGGGAKAAAMLAGAKGAGAAAEGEAAAETPGLVKQVLKGKGVAQEPAQAAVREFVGADEGTPMLKGHASVLDEPLNAIKDKERTAYKAQDEAAGFDVKETRAKLKDAEYKVKQPEIDDATRERLTKSITESKASIADAEEKMKAAGVDPKAADSVYKQRKAFEELRKGIVQHVSADGESVNVDGLLNYAKKLRNSKYGDRLEQIAGKESADSFMEELQKAKDMGAHALKVQKVAKIIGGMIGAGAAGEMLHATQ